MNSFEDKSSGREENVKKRHYSVRCSSVISTMLYIFQENAVMYNYIIYIYVIFIFAKANKLLWTAFHLVTNRTRSVCECDCYMYIYIVAYVP